MVKRCPNCNHKLPRTQRAPTEYNRFVKSTMSTEEIKALPQKEQLAAVAKKWKLFKSQSNAAS